MSNSQPIKIQNSYSGIASAGLDKINFKKNKILLMDKNDLDCFLSGTLENRKVVENSFHHTTLYFKFPKKAKRNILQVRSFLLSIGIPLKYISNINLIMPQLVPYFFVNQISFTFLILLSLIFVMSRYILPYFTYLAVTRFYITTLN